MENWDLYDKNRLPLDKTIKKGEQMPDGTYRMVVHIIIFNSNGQMLIQQRQATRKSWANYWDFSASGSVIAGETSAAAAQRETLEELGIHIDFSNERAFLTVNFEFGFDDFYLIEKNVDIESLKLQSEEVRAVKWASKDEILTLFDSRQFIPYYKSFIEALFEMRKKRGVHKPV